LKELIKRMKPEDIGKNKMRWPKKKSEPRWGSDCNISFDTIHVNNIYYIYTV
jgi:hypothetical protein